MELARRRTLIVIAAVWIAALIAGSLLPVGAKNALGTTSRRPAISLGRFGEPLSKRLSEHRLVHFAAFGVTAFLLVTASRTTTQRMAAVAVTIGLGYAVEFLEHLVYRVDFEIWDVRDDALAVIAGYFAARAISGILLYSAHRKGRA